jgi:iron(III) transport system permease protein
MSIIPLIIPGILFTVSWIMLASPQIGILNKVFGSWFDIYSMAGMVWVDGLHYAPRRLPAGDGGVSLDGPFA